MNDFCEHDDTCENEDLEVFCGHTLCKKHADICRREMEYEARCEAMEARRLEDADSYYEDEPM